MKVNIMSPLDIALSYLRAGYSIVPIKLDKSKSPSISWKKYQIERMTEEDAQRIWGHSPAPGFAIVCGKVSGNLEVIDFDDYAMYEQYALIVNNAGYGDLLNSLTLIQTPRPGVHAYLRVEPESVIPGNSKLAERRISRETLIETRGEGGYVLAPGSPGACHPTGKEYVCMQGNLLNLSPISSSDWDSLRALAMALTEVEPALDEKERASTPKPEYPDELKPGADYNLRGNYEAVLEEHGWRRLHTSGTCTYWCRPGKTQGISASTNHNDSGLFWCFSSNAYPFEPNRSYTPMAVYAMLLHGGNYSGAAKQLAQDGYGSAPKSQGFKVSRPGSNGMPQRERSSTPLTEEENRVGKDLVTLNNLELAHMWARENENTFAYLEGDRYWKCDGRLWEYSSIEAVMKSIQDFLERMQEEGQSFTINRSKVTDVQFLSRHLIGPKRADIFDGKADWIPLRNGVYDMATGCLIPHSPANNISRITDYDYDPAATCPRFLQFLDEVIIEENSSPCLENINALQLAFGYQLIPSNRLQTSLLLIGSGSNGKGVLTRVMEKLVGAKSVTSIPIEQLHDPYHRADLQGKLIGFVNEPDAKSMVKNGNWFKAIVGGDPISARRPTEKVFSFTPYCRLVISCNEMPRTKDLSNGYFRRIVIIEFRRQFDNPDTTLDDQLTAELPGIFNWAVQGLQRLIEDPHLKIASESSRKLISAYKRDEDNVLRFMDETYERGISDQDRIPATDIYYEYKQWCESNGEYLVRGDLFGKKLSKMGYESRAYRGYKDNRSMTIKYRLPIIKIGDEPAKVEVPISDLPL